jgi:hypothetical protein
VSNHAIEDAERKWKIPVAGPERSRRRCGRMTIDERATIAVSTLFAPVEQCRRS